MKSGRSVIGRLFLIGTLASAGSAAYNWQVRTTEYNNYLLATSSDGAAGHYRSAHSAQLRASIGIGAAAATWLLSVIDAPTGAVQCGT